jgi:hypothetical protein
MIRFFVFLAISLTFSRAAMAQSSPSFAERVLAERAEYRAMRTSLGLTLDQETKLRALVKKYTPSINAVRGKYSPLLKPFSGPGRKLTPEETKKQAELQDKLAQELAPILAKKQLEEFTVYTKDQRAKIEAYEKKHPKK